VSCVRLGVARNQPGCTGTGLRERQTRLSAPHRHSAWPGPGANHQTLRSASHEVCVPFSACRPRCAGSEMPAPNRCRFGVGCRTPNVHPGLRASPLRFFAAVSGATGSVRHVVTVKVPGRRVSRDVVTLTALEGGRCTFTERHRSCERAPVRVPAAARQPCRTEPSRLLPLRRLCAAVLSARGGYLRIDEPQGPARPGRTRCGIRKPPTGPAALIGLPKSLAGYSCLGLFLLQGCGHATCVQTGLADGDVCAVGRASSAPGAHPRPPIRSWVFGALPAQTCR
jgi:hypothetical protein